MRQYFEFLLEFLNPSILCLLLVYRLLVLPGYPGIQTVLVAIHHPDHSENGQHKQNDKA